jgi:hypothetical protein
MELGEAGVACPTPLIGCDFGRWGSRGPVYDGTFVQVLFVSRELAHEL